MRRFMMRSATRLAQENECSALVTGESVGQVASQTLPALVCSILGNVTGAQYAIRGGSRKVRGMMFAVLGLLFAKMLWELIGAYI